jgi:hypothetical protein
MRFAALSLMLCLLAMPSWAASQGGPIALPQPLFPPNNWWNLDVSAAPVDPSSTAYINFIGANTGLHPDFGGDAGGGFVYGFPFIRVDGSQTKKTVIFTLYGDESDGVGVPFYPVPNEAITLNGWVESGPPGNVDLRDDEDRHILMVDETNNHLYELYNVWFNGTNWEAASGAFFDMNTNNRRPEGWTSADAAGLAILPGLVRYDEVNAPGEIRHAFRMTLDFTNEHVYPASHTAGSTAGALPMGARLRLKAAKDISTFPADVQKIFRAFKKYGLIVADNGSDMYISGAYDTRWDNDVLNPAFNSLKASDFEVIQLGWHPPVTFVVTLSEAVGSGDPADLTLTAYNQNYTVATGYTGTVQFTSSDGLATLPVNYTFTGADAGTHTFPGGLTLRTGGTQTVTATDIADATITGSRSVVVGPPTPVGLSATATGPTTVQLSWTPSAGAASYQVYRKAAGAGYLSIATPPGASYSDTTASSGAVYLYKVRALDAAARPSPLSAPDLASVAFFTDDPATTSTVVKAVHFTELRTVINAMLAAGGLASATFTDPALNGVPVKAIHLQELRAAVSQARAALGVPALTFTDPAINAGTSVVRAVHVNDLRNGTK